MGGAAFQANLGEHTPHIRDEGSLHLRMDRSRQLVINPIDVVSDLQYPANPELVPKLRAALISLIDAYRIADEFEQYIFPNGRDATPRTGLFYPTDLTEAEILQLREFKNVHAVVQRSEADGALIEVPFAQAFKGFIDRMDGELQKFELALGVLPHKEGDPIDLQTKYVRALREANRSVGTAPDPYDHYNECDALLAKIMSHPSPPPFILTFTFERPAEVYPYGGASKSLKERYLFGGELGVFTGSCIQPVERLAHLRRDIFPLLESTLPCAEAIRSNPPVLSFAVFDMAFRGGHGAVSPPVCSSFRPSAEDVRNQYGSPVAFWRNIIQAKATEIFDIATAVLPLSILSDLKFDVFLRLLEGGYIIHEMGHQLGLEKKRLTRLLRETSADGCRLAHYSHSIQSNEFPGLSEERVLELGRNAIICSLLHHVQLNDGDYSTNPALLLLGTLDRRGGIKLGKEGERRTIESRDRSMFEGLGLEVFKAGIESLSLGDAQPFEGFRVQNPSWSTTHTGLQDLLKQSGQRIGSLSTFIFSDNHPLAA